MFALTQLQESNPIEVHRINSEELLVRDLSLFRDKVTDYKP